MKLSKIQAIILYLFIFTSGCNTTFGKVTIYQSIPKVNKHSPSSSLIDSSKLTDEQLPQTDQANKSDGPVNTVEPPTFQTPVPPSNSGKSDLKEINTGGTQSGPSSTPLSNNEAGKTNPILNEEEQPFQPSTNSSNPPIVPKNCTVVSGSLSNGESIQADQGGCPQSSSSNDIDLSGDKVVEGTTISIPPDISQTLPPATINRGDRIVYTTFDNNQEDIVLSTVGGTSVQTLTQTSTNENSPIFSTQSEIIIYSSDQIAPGLDLFQITPNKTNLLRLTHQFSLAKPLSWSNQNELILQQGNEYYVYQYATKTSNQILTGLQFKSPTWSPNGTQFAINFQNQLATIQKDGSQFQFIPANIPVTGQIDWSPDGNSILFESNQAIYKINIAGGIAQLLSNQQDSQPRWSPDNTKIVFTSKRTGQREIFTMNQDGSNVSQISSNSGESYHPDW